MFKNSNIVVDLRTLGTTFFLVEVTPDFEYVNNEKTEKVLGYKYHIALPDKGFEKIAVRIPGKKLLDVNSGNGEIMEVEFVELELGVYERDHRINLTAKAKGISEIPQKK